MVNFKASVKCAGEENNSISGQYFQFFILKGSLVGHFIVFTIKTMPVFYTLPGIIKMYAEHTDHTYIFHVPIKRYIFFILSGTANILCLCYIIFNAIHSKL